MGRKRHEDVAKLLKENNCELLSNYIDSKTNLHIRYSCGKDFYKSLSIMSRNKIYMCDDCKRKRIKDNLRLSYDEIVQYVESINYQILTNKEEYIDTKHKVELMCDKGHKIKMEINKLRNGRRCKYCNSVHREPKVPYEERVKMVESFGYKMITRKEQYKKLHSKVQLMCPEGHIYECNLSDFQQGCRCNQCKGFKGEKLIHKYLSDKKIDYKSQFKFEDCKFKHKLPFDFYLPKYNLLIEFDGKQHYKFKNVWGGMEGFIDRKIRDTIKDVYCKEKEIKLIRIPYWEFDNIETILNKELR